MFRTCSRVKFVHSSKPITWYSCPWYCTQSLSLSQYPSLIRAPFGKVNAFSSALNFAYPASSACISNWWFSRSSGNVRRNSNIRKFGYRIANSTNLRRIAHDLPPPRDPPYAVCRASDSKNSICFGFGISVRKRSKIIALCFFSAKRSPRFYFYKIL